MRRKTTEMFLVGRCLVIEQLMPESDSTERWSEREREKEKWKSDWNVDRRGQRDESWPAAAVDAKQGSSSLARKIVKTTFGASDVTFETQLGVIQLINYHRMKDDSRDSTACCVTQHVGKRVSKAVIIEQKLRVVRDFECVHVKEIRCTARERTRIDVFISSSSGWQVCSNYRQWRWQIPFNVRYVIT